MKKRVGGVCRRGIALTVAIAFIQVQILYSAELRTVEEKYSQQLPDRSDRWPANTLKQEMQRMERFVKMRQMLMAQVEKGVSSQGEYKELEEEVIVEEEENSSDARNPKKDYVPTRKKIVGADPCVRPRLIKKSVPASLLPKTINAKSLSINTAPAAVSVQETPLASVSSIKEAATKKAISKKSKELLQQTNSTEPSRVNNSLSQESLPTDTPLLSAGLFTSSVTTGREALSVDASVQTMGLLVSAVNPLSCGALGDAGGSVVQENGRILYYNAAKQLIRLEDAKSAYVYQYPENPSSTTESVTVILEKKQLKDGSFIVLDADGEIVKIISGTTETLACDLTADALKAIHTELKDEIFTTAYDGKGQLLYTVMVSGAASYYRDGVLEATYDESGVVTEYDYVLNDKGQIVGTEVIRDKVSRIYDKDGNLKALEVDKGNGKKEVYYYENGQVSEIKTLEGKVYAYTKTSSGMIASLIEGVNPAAEGVSGMTYDAAGAIKTISYKDGRVQELASGDVIKETAKDGTISSFRYQKDDKNKVQKIFLISSKDPDMEYEYTALGKLSFSRSAKDNIVMIYDADERIQEIRTGNSVLYSYQYTADTKVVKDHVKGTQYYYQKTQGQDPKELLVKERTVQNVETQYAYDASERVSFVQIVYENKLINQYTYTYKPDGIKEVRDLDANVKTYDKDGNLIYEKESSGREYRITSQTRDNKTTQSRELVKYTSENGTIILYDKGRVIEIRTQDSRMVKDIQYDKNGTLVYAVITYPDGRIERINGGKSLEIELPSGGVRRYEYGKLKEEQDAQGYKKIYTYEAASGSQPALIKVSEEKTKLVYIYDAATNKLQSVADHKGITYTAQEQTDGSVRLTSLAGTFTLKDNALISYTSTDGTKVAYFTNGKLTRAVINGREYTGLSLSYDVLGEYSAHFAAACSQWQGVDSAYGAGTLQQGSIIKLIDINGDGKADRVMSAKNGIYDHFDVQLNNGHDFDPVTRWDGVYSNTESTDANWGVVDNNSYVKLVDMNGDGLVDRVMRAKKGTYNYFLVQLNNGHGFDALLRWEGIDNQTNSADLGSPEYGDSVRLVDINGDGLADRVCIAANNVYDHFDVQLNNGHGFDPMIRWEGVASSGNNSIWGTIENNHYVTLIDMNADGLPDRVMRCDFSPYNYFEIQWNNGHGFDAPVRWAIDGFNGNGAYATIDGLDHVKLVDVNGDGLTDRLLRPPSGPYDHWLVQYNNGKGFEKAVRLEGVYSRGNDASWGTVANGTSVVFTDMNGDGLLDRVLQRDNGTFFDVQLNQAGVLNLKQAEVYASSETIRIVDGKTVFVTQGTSSTANSTGSSRTAVSSLYAAELRSLLDAMSGFGMGEAVASTLLPETITLAQGTISSFVMRITEEGRKVYETATDGATRMIEYQNKQHTITTDSSGNILIREGTLTRVYSQDGLLAKIMFHKTVSGKETNIEYVVSTRTNEGMTCVGPQGTYTLDARGIIQKFVSTDKKIEVSYLDGKPSTFKKDGYTIDVSSYAYDKTKASSLGMYAVEDWGRLTSDVDTSYYGRSPWYEDFVRLVDINGDGRLDRVLRATNSKYDHFEVQLGTKDGFGNLIHWNGVWSNGNQADWGTVDNGASVKLMDINGDGRPDRVLRASDGKYDHFDVQLNNGSGFDAVTRWSGVDSRSNSAEWGSLDNNSQVKLIDMNGDGLVDRVLQANDGKYDHFDVQLNNGKGFDSIIKWQGVWTYANSSAWGVLDNNGTVKFIDINGDGLPDRVLQSTDGTNDHFDVQLNNGHGFEKIVQWTGIDVSKSYAGSAAPEYIEGGHPGSLYGVRFVDINGDGLPDRVMKAINGLYDHFDVQLNNGHGFDAVMRWDGIWTANASSQFPAGHPETGTPQHCNGDICLADIDGDGLLDRLQKGDAPYWTCKVNRNQGNLLVLKEGTIQCPDGRTIAVHEYAITITYPDGRVVSRSRNVLDAYLSSAEYLLKNAYDALDLMDAFSLAGAIDLTKRSDKTLIEDQIVQIKTLGKDDVWTHSKGACMESIRGIEIGALDATTVAGTVSDVNGTILHSTQADGKQILYTARGDIQKVINADGTVSVEYVYDSEGNLSRIIMHEARKSFDAELTRTRQVIARNQANVLRELAKTKSTNALAIQDRSDSARLALYEERKKLEAMRYQQVSIPGNLFGGGTSYSLEIPEIAAALAQIDAALAEVDLEEAKAYSTLDSELKKLYDEISKDADKALKDLDTQRTKYLESIYTQEQSPVIYHYYRQLLGRDPSKEEITKWVNTVHPDQGADIAVLKKTLLESQAHQDRTAAKERIITSVTQKLSTYLKASAEERTALLVSLGFSEGTTLINLTEADLAMILEHLKTRTLHFGQSATGALLYMLKNQGIEASEEDIACRAIMIDVLTGTLNRFTDGELELSLFALEKTAQALSNTSLPQGSTVQKAAVSAQLTYADLLAIYKADPSTRMLAHINSNHYVVITKVTEDEVSYFEASLGPSGETQTISFSEFQKVWRGYVLGSSEVSSPVHSSLVSKRITDTQSQRIRGAFFPFLIPIIAGLITAVGGVITGIVGVIGGIITAVGPLIAGIIQGLALAVMNFSHMLYVGSQMLFAGIQFAGTTLFNAAMTLGAKAAAAMAGKLTLSSLVTGALKTAGTIAVGTVVGEGLKKAGVNPIAIGFIQAAVMGAMTGGLGGAGCMKGMITSLAIQGTSTALTQIGLPPALVSVCSIFAGATTGALFSPLGFGEAFKTQVLASLMGEAAYAGITTLGDKLGMPSQVSYLFGTAGRAFGYGAVSSYMAGGTGNNSPNSGPKQSLFNLAVHGAAEGVLQLALETACEKLNLSPLVAGFVIAGVGQLTQSVLSGDFTNAMKQGVENLAYEYLTLGNPYYNVDGTSRAASAWEIASYHARMNGFVQQVGEVGLLETLKSYTASILTSHGTHAIYGSVCAPIVNAGVAALETALSEMQKNAAKFYQSLQVVYKDTMVTEDADGKKHIFEREQLEDGTKGAFKETKQELTEEQRLKLAEYLKAEAQKQGSGGGTNPGGNPPDPQNPNGGASAMIMGNQIYMWDGVQYQAVGIMTPEGAISVFPGINAIGFKLVAGTKLTAKPQQSSTSGGNNNDDDRPWYKKLGDKVGSLWGTASLCAKRGLAKDIGDIPRSATPTKQGRYGQGTKWWEYKDTKGNTKIVVEHPDGTVHVGIPKPQSTHYQGGPPKYYPIDGSGHVGE